MNILFILLIIGLVWIYFKANEVNNFSDKHFNCIKNAIDFTSYKNNIREIYISAAPTFEEVYDELQGSGKSYAKKVNERTEIIVNNLWYVSLKDNKSRKIVPDINNLEQIKKAKSAWGGDSVVSDPYIYKIINKNILKDIAYLYVLPDENNYKYAVVFITKNNLRKQFSKSPCKIN